ncbi:uncharacterized protein L203_103676 [Cryptococcus depauperatus CBS 7841]|uniref:Uncharacterized protein n=1 Tax=Cryptococcus depauperatus CBS 7841 TaxID=1295531 RepID=A0A1E3IEN0_9TREE|nr:anaphase-promoting complex subunit 11 [Cryptococcus depauperatus CBS 7841]
MKVKISSYNAVAYWLWDVSDEPHKLYHYASPDAGIMDDDDDEEICGICQAPFESTCPECKVPGDDCPLIWGECTHVFHMHCLLKWIGQKEDESQQQCPMDRRPWVTADRKPDKQTSHSEHTTNAMLPASFAEHRRPGNRADLSEEVTAEQDSMEVDEQ